MKKAEVPFPLQMVRDMNRIAPKWTEYADTLASQKGEIADRPGFDWDDLCVLPIGAGIAVAKESKIPRAHPVIMGRMVSCLYAWRMYKQIYKFDEDMVKILLDTEISRVPWDTLKNLPYPSVYIQADLLDGYDGFFVWFEDDPNRRGLELRFDFVGPKETPLALYIHKTGDSLQAGLDAATDMIAENVKGMDNEVEIIKRVLDTEKYRNQLTAKCLLLTLYLCADNAEADEDPNQKAVHKDFNSKKPKDRYSEIRSWNVGKTTGERVRKYQAAPSQTRKSIETSGSSRSSSPKSPHIRRAHWHHYWEGSRDSDNRKRTLKWIAPTFIHGEEIDGVTVNLVEKPS